MPDYDVPDYDVPDYDVVVFGGGPAGVPAALQSARIGARTLLVEKSSGLGGTTTNANIAFPGLFHAWGEQVIAGIGWDLVTGSGRVRRHGLDDRAVRQGGTDVDHG